MVASRGVNIVRPRTVARSLTAQAVAKAYNFPSHTGSGHKVAIVELGGAVNQGDLAQLGYPAVKTLAVDGARPVSDGPSGADGEVMLDVEVVQQVAPGAEIIVIFGPNTDQGFYDTFAKAGELLGPGDAISCSWGGPENNWDTKTMELYHQLFGELRAKGINIFVASGDTGSQDQGGDGKDHVDFPASSPNVIACGGTRLTVNSDGSRADEVTWNNDPTRSATGGGDSVQFPGRAVPDVAGNADPSTGYEVLIDGQRAVIGGTSAVAPLYAALAVKVAGSIGQPFDFQKTILANPEVCFDVTAGDNGSFRAGPGRDKVTGFGVVDGTKLVGALVAPPVVTPAPVGIQLPDDMCVALDKWAGCKKVWWPKYAKRAADLWSKFRGSRAWLPVNK